MSSIGQINLVSCNTKTNKQMKFDHLIKGKLKHNKNIKNNLNLNLIFDENTLIDQEIISNKTPCNTLVLDSNVPLPISKTRHKIAKTRSKSKRSTQHKIKRKVKSCPKKNSASRHLSHLADIDTYWNTFHDCKDNIKQISQGRCTVCFQIKYVIHFNSLLYSRPCKKCLAKYINCWLCDRRFQLSALWKNIDENIYSNLPVRCWPIYLRKHVRLLYESPINQ